MSRITRMWISAAVIAVFAALTSASLASAKPKKATPGKPATPGGPGPAAAAAATRPPLSPVAYRKIDLNTASEADLAALPGMGVANAKKIIAARPYNDVTELSRSHISGRTMERVISLVSAGPAPAKIAARPAAPAEKASAGKASDASAGKGEAAEAADPGDAARTPRVTGEATPSAPPATANKREKAEAESGSPVPDELAPHPSQPGMVWVNTSSGIFYHEGARWYGKTKEGMYLSEPEAMKAGYRVAKAAGAAGKKSTK